jgi:hypothetical protein
MFRWWGSKDVLMQSGVIIPRVHVTRNKIRVHRNAPDLVLMKAKKGFQATIWIEGQQLIAKAKIN